ncbi:MAG: response regulator [Cytophagaceae bacterium]|jgi:signal transduction histidine kinase/DNA-binding response OmpR family regulator/streptogramin lyase|nr:response regulator [Cytophagaceae bacterium]
MTYFRWFILLFIISISATAQQVERISNFRYYSSSNGFYGDKVRAITQDDRGYLWFGTNEGIFTYNGWSFEKFNFEDSTLHSIVNGIIWKFFIDSQRRIWVGTNTGLVFFDQVSGTWQTCTLPNFPTHFITGITEDEKKTIWISTNHGIYQWVKGETKEIIASNESIDMANIVYGNKKLWIIGYNNIYTLNQSNQLVLQLQYTSNSNKADNFTIAYTFDPLGHIWIGKYDGNIFRIHVESKTIDIIDTKRATQNPSSIVNYFFNPPKSPHLYVCLDEGGVYQINKKSLELKNTLGPSLLPKLSTLKVTGVFIDKESNTWFSLEKNGLVVTNDLLNSFEFISIPTIVNNSIVSAVLKDSKQQLWIGTDGGGLVVQDKIGKLQHIFKHQDHQPNSISDNAILSIFEDSKKNIWVGSFRGGLSLYNPTNSSFKNYTASSNKINGLQRNDIRKIQEDAEGNLWLVVHGHGISRFNPTTETFTNYPEVASLWTYDVMIDKNGTVWAAGNNGVSYFDKKSQNFITLPCTRIGIDIHSLCEDAFGTLWMGTVKGLYYLDASKTTLKQLPFESILNKGTITAIKEVAPGKLIITTRKGIIVYDIKKRQTFYYSQNSGLPTEECIVNSIHVDVNKNVYVGSSKGLFVFNSTQLPQLILSEHPLVHKIDIFNTSITEVLDLHQSIDQLTSIALAYDQNHITFHFSFPHYQQSLADYTLEYQLVGIDKEWRLSTLPVIQYPSLPAGSYTMQVRMVSKSSAIHKGPIKSIDVTILPPFWETWWFRFGLVLLSLLGLYYYYQWKTKNIIAQNRLLEERINERTEKLNQQNKLLDEQKEALSIANQTKDKLFSIIAHDLRSPFSSILGLARMLTEKRYNLKEEEKIKVSETIYKSSLHAFELLDNLLDWARTQTDNIRFHPRDCNVAECIRAVVKPLEQTIQEKKSTLLLPSETNWYVSTDPELLKTILRNLVSNAIKFSPPSTPILIQINIDAHDALEIVIQDNGIGMPESYIHRLLVENEMLHSTRGTSGEQGTGLGLWLCKELIQKINAKWTIDSLPDKGTTISLRLPGKAFKGEALPLEKVEKIASDQQHSEPVLSHDVTIVNSMNTSKGKKLLLVDDTPEVLASIYKALDPYYTVLTATNGLEALDILENQDIDIILSDVMMPEMDGIELSSQIKKQDKTSHIPILLLTSQKSEFDIIKGLQTGADDYLIKPIHADILLVKIQQTLIRMDRLRKRFLLDNKEILEDLASNSVEQQLLQKVLQIIDDQLHDEGFGVEELSKRIGMHRSSLSKKIVQIAQVTPQELIKTQRLKKAAQLIVASGLTIAEVAYDVGFTDPKYFSRSFKTYFGVLPSEYVLKSK